MACCYCPECGFVGNNGYCPECASPEDDGRGRRVEMVWDEAPAPQKVGKQSEEAGNQSEGGE